MKLTTLIAQGYLASSPEQLALEYVEEVVPFISRAINDNPRRTISDMHQVFWMCLAYGPKFLSGGRIPDARQKAIAKTILAGVDPRMICATMETAVSRDLEGLAWTFAFAHEVEKGFATRVAATLSEQPFFASTANDWRDQSGELQQLIRFFAIGKDMQPASNWIRANKERIHGPIQALFAIIAPDVAIEFFRNGKGVQLVATYQLRWAETTGAIASLGRTDKEQCTEIVNKNLSNLLGALYQISLESEHHIIKLFKMLFELSSDLFDKFVSTIDLDDDRCLKLIQQLLSNQPRELLKYRRLVRHGIKVGGKLGLLATQLSARLTS